MKKYIVISTWNGEGYSNSSAKVNEETLSDLRNKCVTKVTEWCELADNAVIEIEKNLVTCAIGDDTGIFSIVEYDGQYGILILPDCNDYLLIATEQGYNEHLERLREEGDDMEEEEGCTHTDFGCEILQKLT
jgi:hypothetical protein